MMVVENEKLEVPVILITSKFTIGIEFRLQELIALYRNGIY